MSSASEQAGLSRTEMLCDIRDMTEIPFPRMDKYPLEVIELLHTACMAARLHSTVAPQTDEREAALEKALRDVLVEAAVQHRHHYRINEPTDMCAVCRAQKALFTVAPQTPASERATLQDIEETLKAGGSVTIQQTGAQPEGQTPASERAHDEWWNSLTPDQRWQFQTGHQIASGAQPEGPRVTLEQVGKALTHASVNARSIGEFVTLFYADLLRP